MKTLTKIMAAAAATVTVGAYASYINKKRKQEAPEQEVSEEEEVHPEPQPRVYKVTPFQTGWEGKILCTFIDEHDMVHGDVLPESILREVFDKGEVKYNKMILRPGCFKEEFEAFFW